VLRACSAAALAPPPRSQHMCNALCGGVCTAAPPLYLNRSSQVALFDDQDFIRFVGTPVVAVMLLSCSSSEAPPEVLEAPPVLGYGEVHGVVFDASGTPTPGRIVKLSCPPWVSPMEKSTDELGAFSIRLIYAPADTVAVPPPPRDLVPTVPGDVFAVPCVAGSTVTPGSAATVTAPFTVYFSLFELAGVTTIEVRESP
jgi:hypothetical protein